MKCWGLLLSFCLLFSALQGVASSDSLKPLKDTLSRIKNSTITRFDLEKKVVSELMGTEKTYKGRAYMSGNLMRLETDAPDKSWIIYDGKILWIVNFPDPQLGGSTQVLKGILKEKDKDKMLLTELLAKGRILESFDIKRTANDAGVSTYLATPKDKKFNLKSVTLVVKNQDQELKRLDYVDDVGNKTSLNILAEKIQAEARPDLFKFKPEKGDQVSHL